MSPVNSAPPARSQHRSQRLHASGPRSSGSTAHPSTTASRKAAPMTPSIRIVRLACIAACRHRPAGVAGAERRHRQRQARAEGARRPAAQPGRARRPAEVARTRSARARRSRAARDLCAGGREARHPGQRRLQGADGAGAPDRADPRAVRGLQEEEPGHRRRSEGRVRQVQGPGHRHRIPGAPHPGGERRRSQEADHADQGRRQVRGAGQEELQGHRARARTAATSTSPSPTPTCPSSARRWSR